MRILISQKLLQKYPNKNKEKIRYIVSPLISRINAIISNGGSFEIVIPKTGKIKTHGNLRSGTKKSRALNRRRLRKYQRKRNKLNHERRKERKA